MIPVKCILPLPLHAFLNPNLQFVAFVSTHAFRPKAGGSTMYYNII